MSLKSPLHVLYAAFLGGDDCDTVGGEAPQVSSTAERGDRMESQMLTVSVIAALLVGYLAGLVSFKVKARWCPGCGETTVELSRRQEVSFSASDVAARRRSEFQ